ncbi:MAG: tetratricopeptide repeat protein [Thermodesulfobacteriota bacterium]|nr:tetratricopeptide repeat protein [Thermodesulfobacteriota bacterium]
MAKNKGARTIKDLSSKKYRSGKASKWVRKPPEGMLLIGLFLLALTVRVVFVFQIQATPLFYGAALDTVEYERLALKLADGNLVPPDAVFLNPLYPFFLASVYTLFGHSAMAVLVLQALMDAANCLLIYWIGKGLFDRRVAVVASFIYACYGMTIFYSGIRLAPTLSLFLTLAFMALFLYASARKRVLFFLPAGVVFGLVALARTNVVLFFPVILLWFGTRLRGLLGGKGTLSGLAGFLIGFLCVLALSGLRNHAIDGRFAPFSVHGGINFYLGNNPDATGRFMSPEGISLTPIEQVKSSIRVAEKEVGRVLAPAEASSFWLRKGLRFWIDHPMDAFGLYLKKLGLFWRHEEEGCNLDYRLSRSFAPIFKLPFISFGLIAPLALVGMVLGLKRRDETRFVLFFVVVYMASVVLFFVNARYRLPAIPFLILFAALTTVTLLDWMKDRGRRRLVTTALFLVPLFVAINVDMSGSSTDSCVVKSHYRNVGLAFLRMGKPNRAISEFNKALSCDPAWGAAYSSLGVAYEQSGQLDEAIQDYVKAVQFDPDLAEAHNNLGAALAKVGRADMALAHLGKAVELRPDFVEARVHLGGALIQQGQLYDAVHELTEALRLDPEAADAHLNLGVARMHQQKLAEAVASLSRAVRLRPDLAEAHYNLALALAGQGNIDQGLEQMAEAARLQPAYREAYEKMRGLKS